jgi:hypothetical protein
MDTDVELAPRVTVQRHDYDFNDLAGGVDQRIIATIGQTPEGCHYFNPAVTVSCPQPTLEFFTKVRQEQARWCRIASQTFKKRERRRVKSWISHERGSNKHARYLDRAACLTGILFIDGRLVPHHLWPCQEPEVNRLIRSRHLPARRKIFGTSPRKSKGSQSGTSDG